MLTAEHIKIIRTLLARATLQGAEVAAFVEVANAPSVGNPTKWIKINDNGTIRSVPAW
jgi:hypothetical protein